MQNLKIEGRIVDHRAREIFEGSVEIENGIIKSINRHATKAKGYITCGFVDAHVHIESSMLTPTEFARLVVRCGVVAVVTDPHEIANVMGAEGVEFMLDDSRHAPIKCFFCIPSSVPATPFDVAGGSITVEDTEALAASGRFVALSEVMNVPGVLGGDKDVLAKLEVAKKYGLPIDGHAPGLSGSDLAKYIANGISTDHESFLLAEAREKLALGMKVHIRTGSSAQNFDELAPIIATDAANVMFCTDDSHPDDILASGHIDKHVRRAIEAGYDLFDVLRVASTNAIEHYGLDVGQLRVGDKADFIVVDNLADFNVQRVYVNGVKEYDAAAAEQEDKPRILPVAINDFSHDEVGEHELAKAASSTVKVIDLVENQIITSQYDYTPKCATKNFEADLEGDILKLVYINRYTNGAPQVAYCRGFRLRAGAIASSISHDSHNIIAVGCSDSELAEAINAVIAARGGLAVHVDGATELLELPIAGIMSDLSGEEVAARYTALCSLAREAGCRIASPFMTLSFLALVVLPELHIGEKGLFSYSEFGWVAD